MPSGPDKQPRASFPRDEIVSMIPALRAFARSFYRDADQADDLVQETLMRGLSGMGGFKPGTNMKSWLFTIMRNAFYTRIRVSNREAPGDADCVSDRPATDPVQEWSVRGREVAEAIERLPPEQREVVMLIGVLGVSYEEAVTICGCAMGTIKSRLNRARARLLVDLGERSPASSVERTDRFDAETLRNGTRTGQGVPGP